MMLPAHARLLVRRTLVATPVALLLPGAMAVFDLIERGVLPNPELVGEALLRALMTVGVLVPITAAVIAVTALKTSRQWLALEQLGFRSVALLLPIQLTALIVAVVLGAAIALAPLPTLYEPTATAPIADGQAWIIPLKQHEALRVDPNAMELRKLPQSSSLSRGYQWSATRRLFFIPMACALLSLLGLWIRTKKRDHITSSLARWVAVAGMTLLAETILGLFVMGGTLAPQFASVCLVGVLAIAGGITVFQTTQE